MNDPVLITGPDRSGTTLAYALLASHPRLSMVRRSNMWRWFDGKFGDLADAGNFERCLQTMLRYRRLSVLEPDPDRIRREFAEGPPSYGRLFGLLHSHHAINTGKARWGDKSLHTEHHADKVFADFPEARFIHMLRDPRDRYASVLKRYDRAPKHIGNVTGQWLASTRQAEVNAARYPDGYLLVRYEDLALSPEPTLRRICDFIEEEYDSSMLAMGGAPDHEEGNSSFEPIAPQTISTASVGRYRTVLSATDINFIEKSAGREMADHGYDLERPLLSGLDLARFYLLGLPSGTAHMWRWQMQHRRREESVPVGRLVEVEAV